VHRPRAPHGGEGEAPVFNAVDHEGDGRWRERKETLSCTLPKLLQGDQKVDYLDGHTHQVGCSDLADPKEQRKRE
jgi:hypothetical protein